MILPDELCLTSIRLWGQLDQSMQRHFDIGKVFQGPGTTDKPIQINFEESYEIWII